MFCVTLLRNGLIATRYFLSDSTFGTASLKDFAGSRSSIKSFHCDTAPELLASAEELGYVYPTSTPGRPGTNGVAENKVRRVLSGARTAWLHAGLDPPWWPFAVRHYCFAENISRETRHDEDGDAFAEKHSAWKARHGKGHFNGPVIPFGCLVDFLPSPVPQQIRAEGDAGHLCRVSCAAWG